MPQRGGQNRFSRNPQSTKFVASLWSGPVPLRFAEVVCQSVCGAPDPFYVSSFDPMTTVKQLESAIAQQLMHRGVQSEFYLPVLCATSRLDISCQALPLKIAFQIVEQFHGALELLKLISHFCRNIWHI